MFSNLSKRAISIEAAELRIGVFAEGSSQRLVAELWLAWLRHNRRCQLEGGQQYTDQCKPFDSIVEFYQAHPWDCCQQHRLLSFEREGLVSRASQMQPQPAAHSITGGVLGTGWWSWYGASYRYNPCTKISETRTVP